MNKLVHARDISMRTSDLENHYVLVEGSLIDHQYRSQRAEASEGSELIHHTKRVSMEPTSIMGGLWGLQKREYLAKTHLAY